eukprot:310398_1
MFWILLGSITSILFCLILHYVQHFQFTRCYKPGKSFISNAPSNSQCHPNRISQPRRSIVNLASGSADSLRKLNKKAAWHCCLAAIDGEKFDFYPFAFLIYVLFLLLVCSMITFKYIYIENNFSFQTNDTFINVQFNDIIANMSYSYHFMSSYSTTLTIIDWIIIYCIIMISSCESLFNFYRYFTIRYSSKYMYAPSPLYTIKYFAIYVVVLCIIFMIQIHFYYLLFPLVICIYFGYNIYCAYSFSAIFVAQYQESVPLIANDMIASVRLMRNISIFSCLISTICIAMFCVIKDINILYYLPSLWSISCIGYTMNFVRNRQILYETIFKSYTCIRHCQINKIKFSMNFKRNSHSLSSTKRKIHRKNIDIIIHSIEEKQDQITGTATPITPMTASPNVTDNIEIDLSINCNKIDNNNKPNKALILLGISNITIPNKNTNNNNNNIEENDNNKKPINKPHINKLCNSYSVDFECEFKLPSNNANKSAGNTPMDDNDDDPYDALDQIESLQMTIKNSSSEKVLTLYNKKQANCKRKRSTSDPKVTMSPTLSTQYNYSNNLLSINSSNNSKHISNLSEPSPSPSPHCINKLPNRKQSKSDDLGGYINQ